MEEGGGGGGMVVEKGEGKSISATQFHFEMS